MYRTIFSLFFLAIVAPALVVASTKTEPKSTFKATIPYGLLIVEVEKDGVWQEVKRLGFTHVYKEQSLDLSAFITKGEPAKVRLRREGGGKHAHLDIISLGGAAPIKLDGGEKDDLALATKKDNDVVSIPSGFVFTFPAQRSGHLLTLTARVEPEKIPTMPFLYPPENIGMDFTAVKTFYDYKIGDTPGSLTLSGDATQVDDAKPLMNVHSVPGSGHPEGPTLVWVRDDGNKLYVALEFTSDNTRDGAVDYAKVLSVGPKGSKEYKITEVDTKWGNAGFTSSKRAAYRHKFYEFAIPLSDVGATNGDDIKLAFAAYGTAGWISPPDGSTINIGTSDIGSSVTLPVTMDSACNNSTVMFTMGGTDAAMFNITKGTCPTLPITFICGTMSACDADITFTPTSAGAKSAILTVTSTPVVVWPFPVTLYLTGTGVGVSGCTDSAASNYDSTATTDDGSCVYKPITITVDVTDGEGGKTTKTLELKPVQPVQ